MKKLMWVLVLVLPGALFAQGVPRNPLWHEE